MRGGCCRPCSGPPWRGCCWWWRWLAALARTFLGRCRTRSGAQPGSGTAGALDSAKEMAPALLTLAITIACLAIALTS